MKIVSWNNLTLNQQKKILLRPKLTLSKGLKRKVSSIIRAVKSNGDEALKQFTKAFDQVNLTNLKVSKQEFKNASERISKKAKKSLEFAKNQIEINHLSQLPETKRVETSVGVMCERQTRPIEKVGLYVPGGSAPLVSTVLMLGVPANLAGCSTRILCTPPNADGEVNPYILVAAELCGIQSVFKVGGAQAIAAMAYGTESIAKVAKIFGPGNSWVTQAKMQISQDVDGAGIDMPAGPSELLVIADDDANPAYIAADLLSQAEHGADSQVMLIALSERMTSQVQLEIQKQSKALPRQDIIRQSLQHSSMIIVKGLDQAIEISNVYAPEHLILQVNNSDQYAASINNAGAVFLGAWTPETLGDYVVGSNHVLPTYGYARHYSGLSVMDFMKFISFQNVSRLGLKKIGCYAEAIAKIEGLEAHKRAVSLRLKQAGV